MAVDRHGVRVGKGAGYSDIEVGLLTEAGLLTAEATIVTTVHSMQVVDERLPQDEHDFTVDYIVTPDEVIASNNPYRPNGLQWESLSTAQLAAIPVLAAAREQRRKQ